MRKIDGDNKREQKILQGVSCKYLTMMFVYSVALRLQSMCS